MRLLRRPWTLYHKVYFHGLLLLVLVAAALAFAGFLLGRGSRWHALRLAQHIAHVLAPAPNGALAVALPAVADELGVDLAVYARDGRLLGSSGSRVPPPLAPEEAARLQGDEAAVRHGPHSASASAGPGRYLRLSLRTPEAHMLPRLVGTLALVILALALGSAPLARAIVRPIEQLGAVARRLGEGDLSARSGLRRGDEFGALARAFDEMAERLGRLLEAHRELLTNVSHELRTPLARIRVTLGLAAEAEPARAQRYVAEIEQDVAELERLVGDVLTVTRLDGGGALVLRREPLDPERAVEEALCRFRRHHPGRSVELRGAAAAMVDAEAGLLCRVFDNLLDNAAKYSEAATPVAVELEPRDGGVAVTVRDRGMGIAPEDQPRIFTPFFRADRSRARGSGGVGLGLALSKRIVEAHGGRITLDSAVGRGTAVTVWLPERQAPPAPGGTS